jgi:hypothetical protein
MKGECARLGRVHFDKWVFWAVYGDAKDIPGWSSKDAGKAEQMANSFNEGKAAKLDITSGKFKGLSLFTTHAQFADVWKTDSGIVLLSFLPGGEPRPFGVSNSKMIKGLTQKLLAVPTKKTRKAGKIKISSQALAIANPKNNHKVSAKQLEQVAKGKFVESKPLALVPLENGTYEISVELLGNKKRPNDIYIDDLGMYIQRVVFTKKG